MSSAIDGLKPEIFWEAFAEVAEIPRRSGNEQRIAAFVLDRAKTLGLESAQDAAGNVVVRKPASPGREDAGSICLQAHLDMVCEKNADTVHDFLNDPIELVRTDGYMMANGTTLGADNGVGVATSLALMADASVEHGPLEMLFTVQEETGLTGAKNLSADLVRSRTLLNLDSEEEGEVYIGCAGGKDTIATWPTSGEDAPAGSTAVSVTVKGLKGGHSGLDIDKGLGNALKIMNRALIELSKLAGRVSSIDGGNMSNAIPRECTAIVYVPDEKLDEASALIVQLNATFRDELSVVDPDLVLALSRDSVAATGRVFDPLLQERLSLALAGLPSGVVYMSAEIAGLVETSTNVSVISTQADQVVLTTSQRSSVASRLSEIVQSVESILQLAGATLQETEGYPGWEPNLDSAILGTAKECYQRLYGKELEVKAIHAGLECGIIGERIPGMDMISFGPTMSGVHSPDEKLEIATVQKFWDFLLEILKSAP